MALSIDDLTKGPTRVAPDLRLVETAEKPQVMQSLDLDLEGKYFLLQYSGERGHAAAIMRVANGSLILEARLPDEDAMNYLIERGVSEVLTLRQEKFNIRQNVLGFNLYPVSGHTTEHYDGIGSSSYWRVVLAEYGVKAKEIDCSRL